MKSDVIVTVVWQSNIKFSYEEKQFGMFEVLWNVHSSVVANRQRASDWE